jgi:Raf kinase inhibitor-like YbhB/YbcL family protein
MIRIMITLILVLILTGCADQPGTEVDMTGITKLTLTSPDFAHEQAIPTEFTCDGKDLSPELVWGDPPAGTQSFALIVDDPDAPAGIWVHWVLYNLPAESRGLPRGVPAGASLSSGGVFGLNSWRQMAYGGPCPPSGIHRYYFTLYALDTVLEQSAGMSKQELLAAMQGHVLGQGQLMGTYTRNK